MPRREAIERCERALLEALRAGHGLGAGFDLTWETGPEARVVLVPSDPGAGRWIARVLSQGFLPGQWLPVPLGQEVPPVGAAVRLARREEGSLPVREPLVGSWTGAILRALGLFPAGIRTRWRFAPGLPAEPRRDSPPEIEPREVPKGFRLRGLPQRDRLARDQDADVAAGPTWRASVAVERGMSPVAETAIDGWARLVGATSAVGGRGRLVFRTPGRWLGRRAPTFPLSEAELAAVLPAVLSRVPGGAVWASREPVDRLTVGRDAANDPVAVDLPRHEGRHLLVLGETGAGKSSALLRLARAASTTSNLVLFDPIGDTGRRLLASLPLSQLRHSVWISPQESPIPIDLVAALRSGDGDSPVHERAIGDLVLALRRVRAARYGDSPFWGPRIEETVRLVLHAAAAIPSATLEDLPRLLDMPFRVPNGLSGIARDSLEALAGRVHDRPEDLDGTRRLLGELVTRSALRRLLGAPGAKLRVAELASAGRVSVVSGDADSIGEDAARYLLAVHLALLGSERLSARGAAKTILILDEVQWYAHETLAELLRLGRRANVHVWLATQSLANLSEELRDAIETNVADFLVFRGAPADARELARLVPAVPPEAFWALRPHEAILLRGKGTSIVHVRLDPATGPRPERVRDRLDAARAASAAYLPPDETRGSEVTSPGDPNQRSSGPSGAPAASRSILLALWSELLDAGPAGRARIRLDEVRRVFDPDGTLVREVGRQLHDAGALVRTDRDPAGTVWEISRAGFDTLLGPGVDPAALETAARRWKARTLGAPAQVATQVY